MVNKGQQYEFYSEMGFRLKKIRQVKRISQNQLADALGMVKQTIQKYESGEVKMPPEIIYRCAKVFQVPIGYFYGEGTAKKYSKASLLIAAEAMLLPNDEMRQRVYVDHESF